MKLDLAPILDAPVPIACKGLPASAAALRVGELGAQGWNLLRGDLPTPVALLKASALSHNLRSFQAYMDRADVRLAPHGKTTMCPQLYARQLEAGAWGITVATFAQARVALGFGVKRLLIANELVGTLEIETLAQLQDADPELTVYSLVDSLDGVARLNTTLQQCGARQPLRVLLEIGFAGGRCGCRSVEAALDIARALGQSPRLALCGIEGYEGLIGSTDAQHDAAAVDRYLETVSDVFNRCARENLFAAEPILLSAGGSAYFDLVARAFARMHDARVLPLVRSGCYVSHDAGFYAMHASHAQQRRAVGAVPELQSALEVWTQVLSRPEPELAILNAGKRDVSFDIHLPFAQAWFRAGMHAPRPLQGCSVSKLSDQHAFLRVPEASELRVGDFVALSISHPCTTFDKWPLLLEVDDDYTVVEGLRTFF